MTATFYLDVGVDLPTKMEIFPGVGLLDLGLLP